MTSDCIRQASDIAMQVTGEKPENIKIAKGSCFISTEFRSFLTRLNIEHCCIHARRLNENAEIEQCNCPMRELFDPEKKETFEALHERVKEQMR